MRSNTSRIVRLTFARFREFWFPPKEPGTYYQGLAVWWMTLLSIPGLVLLFRYREPALGFILSVLVLYPLVYYLVVTDLRYRYPVLWLSLLPVGYLTSELFGSRPRIRRENIVRLSRKSPTFSAKQYSVVDVPRF